MTDVSSEPAGRKPRAIWLVYAAFAVIALTLIAMSSLTICAAEFKWEGFWRGAGQPFATVIAGMAALAAGSLAFYNGERQRANETDQWRAEQIREAAKDLRARFIVAQAQLTDSTAEVRRIGAYAIGANIVEWLTLGNRIERQICVDVLVSYIRTPNPTYVDGDAYYNSSAGLDGPVRATIVRMLAAARRAEGFHQTPAGMFVSARYVGASHQDYVNYDIQGADLRGIELKGDFREVDLCRAKLNNANLRLTNLEGAFLNSAELTGADLTATLLARADLAGANLSNANLFLTDLSKADLGGRSSQGELGYSPAIMSKTDVRGAKFGEVNLRGLDLSDVRYNDKTEWPDGFAPPPSATRVE